MNVFRAVVSPSVAAGTATFSFEQEGVSFEIMTFSHARNSSSDDFVSVAQCSGYAPRKGENLFEYNFEGERLTIERGERVIVRHGAFFIFCGISATLNAEFEEGV
jgi:hypothetical protein